LKKFIDLDDMANVNSAYVLELIYRFKALTRREICDKSALSWGGMTKIVNRLLENGLIYETKTSKPSGRSAGALTMNEENNRILGLDFNKTGFRAHIMTSGGQTVDTFEKNLSEEDALNLPALFLDFAASVFQKYPSSGFASIGIAMQGAVDTQAGVSVSFPGASDWKNVPIKNMLEDRFGVRVYVEHDPDCLLYPMLSSSHNENVLLFRIDRSIGAAVSLAGKLLKGTGILEIAHNVFFPGGKKCACGARGCLEAYIADCITQEGADEKALHEMCLPLACAIKNTSRMFSADKVILTGSLIGYSPLFKERLLSELALINANVSLVFMENCDSAAEGAALIALDKWIQTLKI